MTLVQEHQSMGNEIRQHTFPEIKRELMSRHSIRPLSALLALLALHELLITFVTCDNCIP